MISEARLWSGPNVRVARSCGEASSVPGADPDGYEIEIWYECTVMRIAQSRDDQAGEDVDYPCSRAD